MASRAAAWIVSGLLVAGLLIGAWQAINVSAKASATPQEGLVYPVIAEFGGVHPRPDAAEQPDPALDYKVFVDVGEAGFRHGKPLHSLDRLARLVNLMASAGVPGKNVHLVAVLEGGTATAAMTNEAYQKRYQIDNPNLALLHALHQAGVKVMVCSQAMAHLGLADADISPDATVTLSALTDTVIYGQRGYSYLAL